MARNLKANLKRGNKQPGTTTSVKKTLPKSMAPKINVQPTPVTVEAPTVNVEAPQNTVNVDAKEMTAVVASAMKQISDMLAMLTQQMANQQQMTQKLISQTQQTLAVFSDLPQPEAPTIKFPQKPSSYTVEVDMGGGKKREMTIKSQKPH